MVATKERFEEAFRESGFRITRQRERIFEYLERASSRGYHPSARRVYTDLRKEDHSISVATVYNTLGALVRKKLIKIIEFESGDNRYETRLEPHINLVCSGCGSIQDLPADDPIHSECAREACGFHVLDFRLEYYGLCASCSGPSGPEG